MKIEDVSKETAYLPEYVDTLRIKITTSSEKQKTLMKVKSF